MISVIEINGILQSLVAVVDLGFVKLPTIVLLAVILILFGLGFRKAALSYFGAIVIFAFYLFAEMAPHL